MKKSNTYALVTGASSGIGNAIALECASRGMNVLAIAHQQEQELKDLIDFCKNEHNVKADYFTCDLTDHTSPQKLLEWCNQNDYLLHMLVNNAGIGSVGELKNSDINLTQEMIDLNVRAVALLTQTFLPSLLQPEKGYILNIGSTASFQPIPYKSIYSASKWFVRAFSLALREELRGTSVSVTMIGPGGVPTNEKVRKRIEAQGFMGKISKLEAHVVAKRAINATLKQKAVVLPGDVDRIMLRFSQMFPLTFRAKQLGNRFRGQEI